MHTEFMQPQIVSLSPILLCGKSLSMSFAENKTIQLWQSFMPQRKYIRDLISDSFYSVQIYPVGFNFDSQCSFERWAAMQVSSNDHQPVEMRSLHLPGGWYAVFQYTGLASMAGSFFQYIFSDWFPSSPYIPDFTRPHFEVMGPGYDRNDPKSTEDVYIPLIMPS